MKGNIVVMVSGRPGPFEFFKAHGKVLKRLSLAAEKFR